MTGPYIIDSIPKYKKDYSWRHVLVTADQEAISSLCPGKRYPLAAGMTARIERRLPARETCNSPVDVSSWGDIHVLRLIWRCPTCDASHTQYVPESWIEEGKLVFIAPGQQEVL